MDRPIMALIERLDRDLDDGQPEPAWFAEVRRHLHAYRTCLERHRSANEEPGGLYDELTATEPRMVSVVDRLRAECDHLQELVVAAVAAVARPSPDAGEVRGAVRALVERSQRYRSRCDATWHEAMGVDLGTAVG